MHGLLTKIIMEKSRQRRISVATRGTRSFERGEVRFLQSHRAAPYEGRKKTSLRYTQQFSQVSTKHKKVSR